MVVMERGAREALASLEREARRCRRCAGVAAGSSVMGATSGGVLPAPLLFVAEAPGYLGALRSGAPLCGDRSGGNFERFCAAAGIDRGAAFVTNTVLCHPPSATGGNRAPRAGEIVECSPFLRCQIELVDPALVVALGRVALGALALIEPHGLRFGHDTGRFRPWAGRHLVSLFHPSGRTAGRRSAAQQRADYCAVAAWLAERQAASPVERRSA